MSFAAVIYTDNATLDKGGAHEKRHGMCSFQRAARLPRRKLYARAQHGDTPGVLMLLDAGIAPRFRDGRAAFW
ncbi:hypothetical protein GCM10023096_11780 [Nonomuraea ferruginea]